MVVILNLYRVARVCTQLEHGNHGLCIRIDLHPRRQRGAFLTDQQRDRAGIALVDLGQHAHAAVRVDGQTQPERVPRLSRVGIVLSRVGVVGSRVVRGGL